MRFLRAHSSSFPTVPFLSPLPASSRLFLSVFSGASSGVADWPSAEGGGALTAAAAARTGAWSSRQEMSLSEQLVEQLACRAVGHLPLTSSVTSSMSGGFHAASTNPFLQSSPSSPFSSFFSAQTYQPPTFTSLAGASRNIKLKRARQRVDAGEPRNSYQNIVVAPLRNMIHGQHPRFPAPNGQVPFPPFAAFGQDGLNNLLPHMQNAWLRLQQQAANAGSNHATERLNALSNDVHKERIEENGNKDEASDASPCKVCDDPIATDQEEFKEDDADEIDTPSNPDPVNHMDDSETPKPIEQSPKSKRKSFKPKQVDPNDAEDADDGYVMIHTDDGFADDVHDETAELDSKSSGVDNDEPTTTTSQTPAATNKFQELFAMQQQWYSWMEQQKKLISNGMQSSPAAGGATNSAVAHGSGATTAEASKSSRPASITASAQRDLKALGQAIKQEIISSLPATIDKVISEYAQAEAAAVARAAAQQQQQQQMEAVAAHQNQQRPFYLHPLYHPYSTPGLSFGGQAGASIFPPGFNASWAAGGLQRPKDDFSSMLPRKKRSKVTDTRLSKMPMRSGSVTPSRMSPVTASYFPPTMVGHPMYGSPVFGGDDREDSPGNSDDLSEMGPFDSSMPQSSTLTPMHLRKAKLMFFYTRYPSSALLKSYFPDIRFNKNNTAQLVKWFSNFR
uniref:Prospero domain-containing protein n=1 Tax=Plectus sambesii TaxID=2011161 RepID=A0A914UHW4_9BILA